MNETFDTERFPKVGADRQLYIRDIEFANLHINHDKMDLLCNYLDLAQAFRVEEDFSYLDTGHWTIVYTGGNGSATIIDWPCGLAEFVPDVHAGDDVEVFTPAQVFELHSGYPAYFEIRGKIWGFSDCDFWFGLVDAGFFAGAYTNCVIWKKDDGDTELDYLCTTPDGTTAGTADVDIIGGDEVFGRLGIYWDGKGNVAFIGLADGDWPEAVVFVHVVSAFIPTDITMYLGFGFQIGALAGANALYVDYVKGVQRRLLYEYEVPRKPQ